MNNLLKPAFLLTIGLLLCLRFCFLEQDAPSYMVSGINQEDETSYTSDAIIKAKNAAGQTSPNFESIRNPGLVLAFTPITYISLRTFGFNYLGLRIPVVLLSVLSILILISLLRKLCPGIDPLAFWLFSLMCCLDFYFMMVSRFQNPQIFSITFILLSLWIYFRRSEKPEAMLLLAFTSLSTVLIVYFYNAFFFVACGIFCLVQCYSKKSLNGLAYFFGGCMIALAGYFAALWFAGTSLEDVVNVLARHGGGIDSGMDESAGGLMFRKIITAPLQLINTNFFRFNLPFLLLFFVSMPLSIRAIRRRDSISILLCLCLLTSVLQSAFVISYPFKKLVTMLPLVALFSAYHLYSYFKNEEAIIQSKKWKWMIFAFAILGLLLGFYNFKVNNDPAYWAGFDYGYYENTPAFLNIAGIVSLAFTFIMATWRLFKVNLPAPAAYLWLLLLLAPFSFNAYYFVAERQYKMKEALISMKPIVANKHVAGDIFAFSLYNDGIPLIDHYNYQKDYKTVLNTIFGLRLGDFRVLKYFPKEKRYQGLIPGAVFESHPDYKLVVKEIYPLTYYNLMLLERAD